jgi:hypothetical protein
MEGIVFAFDSDWEGTAMTKKRSLAHRIEMAIDNGATTAEKIHQSIAEFPLKLMEDSELLEKPAAKVRHLQAETIAAFYDLIRDANRRVAKLMSELLRGMGKRFADAGRAA